MRKARVGKRGCAAVTVMVEIEDASARVPVTSADVAAAIGFSPSYLERLFADLRDGALTRSFRGRVGGYRLARPADEISILDIILAAERKGGRTQGGGWTGAFCVDATGPIRAEPVGEAGRA